MKKLKTALLCLLMVFSCAFCVNAEDATEVLEGTPVEVQNETQEAETKVAKIGDVEYATLQEAINAAKNGEEVVLLQDVKEHIRVSDTSNVVLNLNGKTIDNNDNDASTIENLGTLTIKGEGKVLNTTSGNFVLYNRATVVIDGPDFIASKHSDKDFTGIVINEYKATINSGKFTADSEDVITLMTSTGQDAMTINGGVFGNGKLKLYRQHDDNFVLNGGTYFFDYSEMYIAKKFLSENNAFFKNANESYTIKYNKVKLSAYQDGNGDLIIKGPEELINGIHLGELAVGEDGSVSSIKIKLLAVGLGWRAFFHNDKPKSENDEIVKYNMIEKIDDTTLKISKQNLIKWNIVNGKYELSLDSIDHNQPFECEPIEIITDIECKPNQQKTLTVVGEIPEVVAGKSTIIDKSKFVLFGEDEKTISLNNYDLYWCEKLDEENTYNQTSDSVFKKDKTYYLSVFYRYNFDNENDIDSKDIKLSDNDTKHEWKNVKMYGTGGGFVSPGFDLQTQKLATFVVSKGMVPTVVDTIAKIGDKEFTSIQEAIDEANRGDVITLVNDQDESIRIGRYSQITLDIGNYKLTSSQYNTILNEGILTIKGSGQITNSAEDEFILYNGGVATIDGPTFMGTTSKELKQSALINNTAKLTINSGEFLSGKTPNVPWIITTEGKLTIHGGRFGNSEECFVSYDGPIEIDGGTFDSYPKNMTSYLASGYCLSKNANGETIVVKATETTVKEPTVVGNQENLDIVKKTEEFKNIQSVAVNANVKKQLTPNEVKKIEAIVENNKADVSYKIPLNLKLTAIKDDGTETNITKLDKEITITLALSDENVKALKGAKEIKVARFHGDEVTLLDAKLEGNILTFKTDRFSTYVVVGYRQAGGATPTPSPTPTAKPAVSNTSKAGPKDLNADGVITCDEEMGSANWIWSESKKACVYKVSNTSVK